MTQDNQIIALNAADGKQLWNEGGSSAQTGIFGVASPAAAQGTVIAGYSSGELIAYRYENGRSLWADALARTSISTEVGALTDIDADPIIDGGRVYALGQGGRMAAYELVTGQRIWELNLAGISTPAIAGEWIFTLTDDARLWAIARGNGKVRWISELGQLEERREEEGPDFLDRAGARGRAAVGRQHRRAAHAGRSRRRQRDAVCRSQGGDQPAPVVANQTLYLLDDDGTIHAFR